MPFYGGRSSCKFASEFDYRIHVQCFRCSSTAREQNLECLLGAIRLCIVVESDVTPQLFCHGPQFRNRDILLDYANFKPESDLASVSYPRALQFGTDANPVTVVMSPKFAIDLPQQS
jgi:hypothetical protein